MKKINLIYMLIMVATAAMIFTGCKDDEDPITPDPTIDFSGTFVQSDQMGRPAINTVFVPSARKDEFNTTIPSEMEAAFQITFQSGLTSLSPAYSMPGDENALGQDAATFSTLLVNDVLNVSLDGPTTFYDGTNVLTGRNLSDDVITVELLLIFGGENFMENPTLSNDNVSTNDKAFEASFPYLASPW